MPQQQGKILQRSCLKQNHSLRRQLLTSFGTAAFVTLALSVFVSIIILVRAGNLVNSQSSEVMKRQIHTNLVGSTIATAQVFAKFSENYDGVVEQMAELVMDRIVGYPEPGWEEDEFVPFFDTRSQTNRYPIKADPLPLEWRISFDITEQNKANVIPHREHWFENVRHISTYSTGTFFMQGQCDPDMTRPEWITYYRNCAPENNNITTGGAVSPTTTAHGLYKKSGELALLLRPLFEANDYAILMGMYYVNSGSGAVVHYPGAMSNGLSGGYISNGCDWMKKENPFTGKPYGTDEFMARCHPKGEVVNGRDYNVNEREWFQYIVEHRGAIVWYGPFTAAGSPIALMTIGKAVYDRRTGELIGVVGLDVAMKDLNGNLVNSKLFDHSEWGIVQIEDGRVVADSLHSASETNSTLSTDVYVNWQDIGMLSDGAYTAIRNMYKELFAGEWTVEDVVAAAEKSARICHFGHIATAYPLPIPPKEYDPDYEPSLLAFHVVSQDVYNPIEDLEESVNDDILVTSLVATGIAICGMFVVLLMLWCVARVLTQPLLWMEIVSWRIVNHSDNRAGDRLQVEDEANITATARCSPNTEISDLVEEFQQMISGFSGDGASSVSEPEANEIRNTLTWQSDFGQLYTKTQMKGKSSTSNTTAQTPSTEPDDRGSASSASGTQEEARVSNRVDPNPSPSATLDSKASRFGLRVCPAPRKVHTGPVAAQAADDRYKTAEEVTNVYRSRLFWWIVLLIVVPLLITNTLICLLVTSAISNTVPKWIDELGAESLDLEEKSLANLVKSKAGELSLILQEHTRDLLFTSRVSNWLHFGAISIGDSFTDMAAATEECKYFPSRTCPVFESPEYQCPCQWYDSEVDSCSSGYNQSESRRLQRRFFASKAHDYDPTTGNRNSTSFPLVASSPETTLWFSDGSELPGSQKGHNTSGFHTAYDRLRVSSSLAIAEFPVYSYQGSAARRRQWLGSYVGYEADGLFTGFSGCSQLHTGLANFVSDQENRAFEISSELCPEGQYGFDPRCRSWYKTTRDNFLRSREMLHVTAPYVFATLGNIGLSAAAPLANRATGELGGVMLLDFVPYGLSEAFDYIAEISYVIALDEDVYGGDIVIGPEKNKEWEPSRIVDQLFENEPEGSPHRKFFEDEVLSEMKKGVEGSGRFWRENEDGEDEQLFTVYAPVTQSIVSALDPSDLVHGVQAENSTIYSVGITCFDKAMRRPFDVVKNDLEGELQRLSVIDAALISAFTLAFLILACKISVLVTRPMITLLSAVKSINSKEDNRDIPPLQGGSREVHQVYNSFSKLYKVIRISNNAFFSGNLVWAHHIVNDAMQLFRKIDDRKAIGIACNNLGNIMFARILEVGSHSESQLDSSFGPFALRHYDEAVDICQEEFDNAQTTDIKAGLAQELADRLFNRGLCRLFMAGESGAPQDMRQLGLEDISRARDLDYDVKEFLLENKLLLEFSDVYYARTLRRLHGLCTYFSDEEMRNIWDATSLLSEADELLFAAWHEKSAPLFNEVSRVGRLQQLEGAAIRLEGCKGNHAEAARVGMRMFTEDEYLLEAPFSLAAQALLHFAKVNDQVHWAPKTIATVRSDLSKMTKACRSPTLDLGKCIVFAFELNERWEGETIFPSINAQCLNLFDKYCSQEDHVGVVAYTVDGDHTMELSPKLEAELHQRSVLNLATKSTSERIASALPYAMQLVLDSYACQEMDTYILLFTDGYSWDPEPYMLIRSQISRMNRENETNVHLIILGLDVEPEHQEQVRAMCSVSKGSFYVDLTMDNTDETFSIISSIFSAGRLYQEFLSTISMEKF
mmetsp:Transcript_5640/g.11678  ORF Transcript_5640/g.11678 Transcript_5640/m.11678 type:complete len:1810 (-) Transcript_5640:117-5546(-)